MLKKLNPQVKAFLTSILVIFVIMCLTYLLTFFIKAGSYQRILDTNTGYTLLDFDSGYTINDTKFPFYKFILSPFLVLFADGNITIIGILIFLMIIGGTFECVNKCEILKYLINKVSYKYHRKRYLLIALIILLFMLMGSFIGTFEEIVPLVPIIIALALSLGFDKQTGLSMSLLAVGCGFASGILNPFTVGIAQKIAGIKMFSGLSLRILAFILIYALLTFFTIRNAKKKEVKVDKVENNFTLNKDLEKASKAFIILIIIGFAIIISSTFIKAISDYTIIILTLVFLISGIVSCLLAKMKGLTFLKTFIFGIIGYLPAVLLILMASSIKYILVESSRLDTILYYIFNISHGLNKYLVILFIYLVVLIMNFFISSGSAKAFLLIPIILPIAQYFEISYQLCILAYIFGDGFSNVFYPTNPVTLISLQVADVPYVKYAKHTLPLQILILIVTSLLLLFGLTINY